MNIYLSAQWSRRDEIEGYAKELRELGHTVTSRWHHGEPMGDDSKPTRATWARWAQADLDDIAAADVFLAFTELEGTMSRGGRHVEWGVALSGNTELWICGQVESQFYALNDRQWGTWLNCIEFIKQESR